MTSSSRAMTVEGGGGGCRAEPAAVEADELGAVEGPGTGMLVSAAADAALTVPAEAEFESPPEEGGQERSISGRKSYAWRISNLHIGQERCSSNHGSMQSLWK